MFEKIKTKLPKYETGLLPARTRFDIYGTELPN